MTQPPPPDPRAPVRDWRAARDVRDLIRRLWAIPLVRLILYAALIVVAISCTLGARHGGHQLYIGCPPWWPLGVLWVPPMAAIGCTLGAHHGGQQLYIECPPWWPLGVHWVPTMVAIRCTLSAHHSGHRG